MRLRLRLRLRRKKRKHKTEGTRDMHMRRMERDSYPIEDFRPAYIYWAIKVCKMPRKEITEDEKEEIRKRVQREFPGCKALQDIHYYRYVKEIEWQKMAPSEIVKDIKKGARKIQKEMKVSTIG